MFLVVSTNVDDVTPLLDAEFDRLDELAAEGVLPAAWVKSDYSGAVRVIGCADDEAVTTILATLPTAIAGATTFVTTPVVELDSVKR